MKVRLVRAIIQLDLVVDDGTGLKPVEIQPITVPGTNWPLDLDEVLDEVADRLGLHESIPAASNGSSTHSDPPEGGPPVVD